jgi:hypothetical protein|tara:strand:+ start:195 stop:494 length:300 start_codon:yes stop_codon:yes gene_type:complete
MAKYSPTSPYYKTPNLNGNLGIYEPRTFDYNNDDIEYKIDSWYSQRPDLLAFDLYGNAKLWWVFAVRNPDVIKDPVYDFVEGTIIRIPRQDDIESGVGL